MAIHLYHRTLLITKTFSHGLNNETKQFFKTIVHYICQQNDLR